MRVLHTTIAVILTFVGWLITSVSCWEQCTVEQGGGVCPDGNTCCTSRDSGSAGCISGGMGMHHATCCSDGHTGCPKGYECATDGTCRTTPSRPDPLLQVLPRYVLCRPAPGVLTKVYGLPIVDDDALLPYYSSHGSLVQEDPYRSQIEMALVIIHGGGRNADDYFCSCLAAIGLQKQYKSSSVLLVAPRFLTAADGQLPLHDGGGGRAIRWGGKGHGQWRYGAAAVYPRSTVKNITSFDAIDVLMNLLGDRKKFPNLKRIVITGHSVGGQFVQRWSLLTTSWVENRTSAVIMNPSSWTYLTPMRWSKGTWQIPGDGNCSGYNHWTWGLEQHPTMMMHSPYKDRMLERLGVGGLADRFADRRVTYLAGSADRCNVTGKGQWCQSHDLGTACMDELQGSSRLDRHFLYVESLRLVGIETHEHLVVEGVGHDHALMFTSSVALSVLFSSDDTPSGREIWKPGVLFRLLHLSAPFFRASVTRWSIYILYNQF